MYTYSRNAYSILIYCLSVTFSWLHRCTVFNEILHGITLILHKGYSLIFIAITDTYAGGDADQRLES